MATIDTARRKLDLGRVFSDTFGVVRREAGLLFGLALVFYLVPTIANALLMRGVMQTGVAGTPSLALFKSPAYWLLLLVSLLINMLLFACLTQIAIGDLEGRRPTLGEVLQVGLRKCLPLLATSLLLMVSLWLAALFLFVPAFILGAMWAVTFPAVVAETSNVFRAFGRSRALTKGNRWRIFGLLLLIVVLIAVFEGVILAFMGGARGMFGPGGLGIGATIVLGVLGLVVAVLFAVGNTALYVQLRELKGGGGESVAQVFA